ncbi:MAG: transposase, partial [Clostridiales bacterium]|nr:transposase [Clostridiales bacterium]
MEWTIWGMESRSEFGQAFENFFAGRAAHPTFKKRGAHDRFKVSAGFFKAGENRIMLPKTGWIKTFEALRCKEAKLAGAATSRTAEKTVGIDAGVREYATSEGERRPVPRACRNLERQIMHAQRSASRKEKGGKNRSKAKLRPAKLHAKAASIRSGRLRKMAAEIVH